MRQTVAQEIAAEDGGVAVRDLPAGAAETTARCLAANLERALLDPDITAEHRAAVRRLVRWDEPTREVPVDLSLGPRPR